MVSGSLSSPRQGFFPSFSHPTEFAIGCQRVSSLTGWSPWIQSGFHVPRPTQVPLGRQLNCRLRDCPPLWSTIPSRSASRLLCNSYVRGPTTPQRKTSAVWADPRSLAATEGIEFSFRSSGYLDVSIHRVRRNTPMYSACAHSGIPGSTLVCQFPRAFRRLPRPSSPSDTETSPIRPS